MYHHPTMTMPLCRQVLAVAIIFFAIPAMAGPSDGGRLLAQVPNFKAATADDRFSDAMGDVSETSARPVILVSETKQSDPDTDIFALMSGKCSTLKIAGRDFACKAVAYFHGQQGRANFTIALDDPADDSHVISFSGENAHREEQANLYELQIDRMLLNSKDRPKVDGLPVPFVESSTGTCKQLGTLVSMRISSISCSATDKDGKKYELQFDSDGKPITLRKIKQMPLASEKRRARQSEQFECRQKAGIAKILPRDWTPYILQCLAENGEKVPPEEPQ
jgi:hypothetical protein